MYARAQWLYVMLLAGAAIACQPAMAGGLDCGHVAGDAAATIICAHPKLLKLDNELSRAYARALARNPASAADLKEDQRNWLGERDRAMYSTVTPDPDSHFPPDPRDLDRTLSRLYLVRIAYLQNLDNPAAAHGDPVTAKVIAFLRQWPAGNTDIEKALESAGLLVLGKSVDTDAAHAGKTIAELAAPPDRNLQAGLKNLHSVMEGPLRTVEYLPAAGFGGVFSVDGSALCQNWVLFERDGAVTAPREDSDVEGSEGCERDGDATVHPALLAGQPVMLVVAYDQTNPNRATLAWQRWLHGQWGPVVRVRVRYQYLAPSIGNRCQGTPARCAETAAMAVNFVRRYLADPWMLPAGDKLDGNGRAQFQRMLQTAPQRKEDWADARAWLLTHLKSQSVLVGINNGHEGAHITYGAFDVGFWGDHGGKGSWWFVDQNVAVNTGRVLGAAVTLPAQTH